MSLRTRRQSMVVAGEGGQDEEDDEDADANDATWCTRSSPFSGSSAPPSTVMAVLRGRGARWVPGYEYDWRAAVLPMAWTEI